MHLKTLLSSGQLNSALFIKHFKYNLSWPLSAANSAKSFMSAAPEAVKDPSNSGEHNSTFSFLSICPPPLPPPKKHVYKKEYKDCLKHG